MCIRDRNGILLTELWQKRWSGTLQLLEGDRSDWITLESGGPVCAEDSLLLCRAMQGGGMLVTRTCLVDGSGSHESMARLLLWCARSRHTDFVEKNRRRFVLAASAGLQLPIRPDTRRFLQAADGSQRVSELCEQLDLSGPVISPELAALHLSLIHI